MQAFSVLGLPVETQHGKALGKVVNVELDDTGTTFVALHVAPNATVRKILHAGPELLVKQEQIVQVTAHKVIVVDIENNNRVDAIEHMEKMRGGQAIRGHLPSMSSLE